MTKEEAIELAKIAAIEMGWGWKEPVDGYDGVFAEPVQAIHVVNTSWVGEKTRYWRVMVLYGGLTLDSLRACFWINEDLGVVVSKKIGRYAK